MRSVQRWPTFALVAALAVAGAAVAQPPPREGPVPAFGPPGGRLGVDDVVDRIMAFDKNKDGKVSKDELPDRMHDLVARGDTNKDGALDRDEIKKLATAPGGAGVRVGGFGFGFEGPGPGRPGPGPAGLGRLDEVVEDLKLSSTKKDQAKAAVKASQENVRKLMDQARAELLQNMKDILSAEEFLDFKAALERPGGGATVINVGPPDGPRPGELERRLDQLQKEVDELRRQQRR